MFVLFFVVVTVAAEEKRFVTAAKTSIDAVVSKVDKQVKS